MPRPAAALYHPTIPLLSASTISKRCRRLICAPDRCSYAHPLHCRNRAGCEAKMDNVFCEKSGSRSRESKAAGRERMKAFRVSNRDWPNPQSDIWTSSFLLLTFAFHLVPVVQRIEQGFPKTKPIFYHTSSAFVSATQTTSC